MTDDEILAISLIEIEQALSRRLAIFAEHVLTHTTPAAGSTIAKYRGLTIEEIAKAIPDMTAWPEENHE